MFIPTASSPPAIPDDIRDAIELLLKYDDPHEDLKRFLSVSEGRPHDRDGMSSLDGHRRMMMTSVDLDEDVRRPGSKTDNPSPNSGRLEKAVEVTRICSDAMTSPTKDHNETAGQTFSPKMTLADPVTSMKLSETIVRVQEPKSVADVWLQADTPQVPFDILQALNEIEHRLHKLDMQPLEAEIHHDLNIKVNEIFRFCDTPALIPLTLLLVQVMQVLLN
ncbi:unnamed protein product [Dicrocoelium dendriticum]|nr:unnamed protein product [Dicrocoelium dendriticum]